MEEEEKEGTCGKIVKSILPHLADNTILQCYNVYFKMLARIQDDIIQHLTFTKLNKFGHSMIDEHRL